MIVGLFGLLLFLLGPKMITILWFPIIYLGFGVKISPRYWSDIAAKLQGVAAVSSTWVLKFCSIFGNFEVNNRHSTIDLKVVKETMVDGHMMLKPVTESLNVAEACAGLRMLMAFLALGTAIAFLWKLPRWQRVIVVIMTVPVAIAVNVGRVSLLGLLSLANSDYAKGDFHIMVGMFMLIPALLIFLTLIWIMGKIIPADNDKENASAPIYIEEEKERFEPIKLVSKAKWFIVGILAMAVPTLMYATMVGQSAPKFNLPGSLSLIVNGLLKVGWTTVPAAITGIVLVYVAQKILKAPKTRTQLLQTTILLVSGMMVVSVAGLESVNAFTNTCLFKLPVKERKVLFQISNRLGDWKLTSEDPPLSNEILEALGTRNYVSRVYTNEKEKDPTSTIVRFHSAYYTGKVDTVPHVPERCYVAGGATRVDDGRTTLSVSNREFYTKHEEPGTTFSYSELAKGFVRIPNPKQIPVSFLIFKPESTRNGENANNRCVIYFFAANGKFLASPDDVRLSGADPSDKYRYYCKIEILTQADNIEDAKKIAERFLSPALPEIMACLPDWKDVLDGKWPLKN